MNLFIDTSNWRLIYILEKDNKIIDSLIIKNLKKISDIAINELKTFLAKNNLIVQDIDRLYITQGPGSYTGVRVGLGIVKTLSTLNENYEVFLINSLRYQAGINKVVSVLDARGQKNYVGVYENGQALIKEQVVESDALNLILTKYSTFELLRDYSDLDVEKNYLDLKPSFKKVTDVNDIEPLYIKNFI